MYSRAPRPLTQAQSETLPALGPGAYEHGSSLKLAPNYGGVQGSVFGSNRARKTFFPDGEDDTPSPGSYYPQVRTTRVGTRTLADKSKRFHDPEERAPPVGAYNFGSTLNVVSKDAGRKGLQQHKRGGTVQRVLTGASIPSRQEKYGYEEIDGVMVKAAPEGADAAPLGPGSYNVADADLHSVTAKYRVNDFSKRSARKPLQFTEHKPIDGPAPCDYAPRHKAADKRQQARPFQSLARRDVVEPVSKDDGLGTMPAAPSPSAYTVRREFDPPLRRSRGKPVSSCFGTSSRFVTKPSEAPPLGTYEEQRTAIRVKSTNHAPDNGPFMQSSVRFQEQHPIRETPGPGAYSQHDIAADVAKRRNPHGLGAFGSTTSRPVPFSATKEARQVPGPGSYTESPKPTASSRRRGKAAATSVAPFGSTSRRPTQETNMDTPSVTQYDVAKAFDSVKGTGGGTRHRYDRQQQAFGAGPRTSLPMAKGSGVAPTSYNPEKPRTAAKGPRFAEEQRFRDTVTAAPPSTAYTVGTSLVKPSFNATLGRK
eukprot:m.116479 g.116479  ORF g.116479 m.116479 type:complete len:537 (-) comp16378_c1_seq4:113-1723(-)